ncbi:MAG: hypothetical protein U0Q07_12415 [Acidimicrobiales bacterium]
MRAPTELEDRLSDALWARAATVVDDEPPELDLHPFTVPPPPRPQGVVERVLVAAITVAVLVLVGGLLVVSRPEVSPTSTSTPTTRDFVVAAPPDPLDGRRAPVDARPLRLGLALPGAELAWAQNLVDPADRTTWPVARPPWESPTTRRNGYRAGTGLAAPTFYVDKRDPRLPTTTVAELPGRPAEVTDLGDGVEVVADPVAPAGGWVRRWTVRRPEGTYTITGHGIDDATIAEVARTIRPADVHAVSEGRVARGDPLAPTADIAGFDPIDLGRFLPPYDGYGRSGWHWPGAEAEVGTIPASSETIEAMAADAVTGATAATLQPVRVRDRDGVLAVLPDGSWWVRWDEPDAHAIGELVVRGDRAALDAALAAVDEVDATAYLQLAAARPPDPAQRWSCPSDPAWCRAAAVDRLHALDLLSVWRKGPTGLEGFGPVPGMPAPPDQYRGGG